MAGPLVTLSYVIYQYTNTTRGSAEYGFTYTGQTKNEERRKREHETCTHTNRHMKAARARGDSFAYRVLERMEWSCPAAVFDDETEQSRLQTFLQKVTAREAVLMTMWPDGGYNLRDETGCQDYRALMWQAQREVHDRHWTDVLAPAFEAYYAQHGEIWSVPTDHPILGTVVRTMRSQSCYIQDHPERLEWLKSMKWSDSYSDGMWTHVIAPAFEAYYAKHGQIWTVPNDHPILGSVVHNMRSNSAYIRDHPERLEWLETMKWSNSYDDGKWTHVIAPAFEAYYAKHGDIWTVPQDHPILGKFVANMRARGCYISDHPERREWLATMKWADSYDDGKWTHVLAPALTSYHAEHGTLARIPQKHPTLGAVVDKMRTRGAYIRDRPARKLWLEERGFVYHARNLQRHLDRCVSAYPLRHLVAANAAIVARRRARGKKSPRILFPTTLNNARQETTQWRVYEHLRDAFPDLTVRLEHPFTCAGCEGTVHADVAVLRGTRPVAVVEVDGPHHFIPGFGYTKRAADPSHFVRVVRRDLAKNAHWQKEGVSLLRVHACSRAPELARAFVDAVLRAPSPVARTVPDRAYSKQREMYQGLVAGSLYFVPND